jgi:hypothetical protein
MYAHKYEIPNNSTAYETPAISTHDQFPPPDLQRWKSDVTVKLAKKKRCPAKEEECFRMEPVGQLAEAALYPSDKSFVIRPWRDRVCWESKSVFQEL